MFLEKSAVTEITNNVGMSFRKGDNIIRIEDNKKFEVKGIDDFFDSLLITDNEGNTITADPDGYVVVGFSILRIIAMLPQHVQLSGDIETREVFINGSLLEPHQSLRIRKHSPDGFLWGYGGSGPAQLALAILLEYLPIPIAENYYQRFKQEFVAKLPQTKSFDVVVNIQHYIASFYEADMGSFKNNLKQCEND